MENTPRALRGGDRASAMVLSSAVSPAKVRMRSSAPGVLGPKAFRPDRQPALIAPEQGDRGSVPKQVLGAG